MNSQSVELVAKPVFYTVDLFKKRYYTYFFARRSHLCPLCEHLTLKKHLFIDLSSKYYVGMKLIKLWQYVININISNINNSKYY